MVVGDVNHRAKCLSVLFHFNRFPDVLGLEHQMQAGRIAYTSQIYAFFIALFFLRIKIHTLGRRSRKGADNCTFQNCRGIVVVFIIYFCILLLAASDQI